MTAGQVIERDGWPYVQIAAASREVRHHCVMRASSSACLGNQPKPSCDVQVAENAAMAVLVLVREASYKLRDMKELQG